MFLKTVILVLKHNEKNTYKGVASPRIGLAAILRLCFFFTKTMNSEIGYHDPRLNNSRFCNAFQVLWAIRAGVLLLMTTENSEKVIEYKSS